MQDYRQDILNIHKEIEENLDFVLDVDNLSVKKYYSMLDELDNNYISIEDIDEERIITLYNTDEEGLEYLTKLKELLFFIKKNTIELNLKKIKMLFRRKKKKEELIIILRLLKEWQDFYEENKEKFSKEEKGKIENYFESIKNIKDEKIVIKKSNIKDNIKLTTMIGITEVVSACKLVLPTKDKEKITKEIKKIESKEKLENNINVTKIPEFVYIVSSKKVGISNKTKENVKKNSENTIKRQKDQKEIIDMEIIEKETVKEEKSHIKEVAQVATAISLGAATVVALPTVAKTVAAVEALKILTENEEEYKKQPEDTNTNNSSDEEEIIELIEELETEKIDIKEEKEILKENGLEKEIEEEKTDDIEIEEIEPLTKEERFKVLKMNFENNEKSTSKPKILRVTKEEKKVKKEDKKKKENKKKPKIKKKNPLKKFISKIGRVAFLLSMNIALAGMLEKQAAKNLVVGKPKVLK